MDWYIFLLGKSDPAFQNLVNSVPLISVRGSWGSGFTAGIHGNEVILLTCNHVVKDCSLSAGTMHVCVCLLMCSDAQLNLLKFM